MYYRNKYKSYQINKICKSSQLRKNKIFKKNIFVNNTKLSFDIINLKNHKDILDFLACKKSWDDKTIFLLKNKKNFSTLFFASNVDIVCCNIKWEILKIIKGCAPNTEIDCPIKTANIWVMQENLSTFLNLKLNNKFTYISI